MLLLHACCVVLTRALLCCLPPTNPSLCTGCAVPPAPCSWHALQPPTYAWPPTGATPRLAGHPTFSGTLVGSYATELLRAYRARTWISHLLWRAQARLGARTNAASCSRSPYMIEHMYIYILKHQYAILMSELAQGLSGHAMACCCFTRVLLFSRELSLVVCHPPALLCARAAPCRLPRVVCTLPHLPPTRGHPGGATSQLARHPTFSGTLVGGYATELLRAYRARTLISHLFKLYVETF